MIAYFALTFAVFFVVGLIAFLIYASPGAKKKTNIPGPPPSDKETGNLSDIARAGSLHNFLCELHDSHGSVAGFYFGEQFVVSLANQQLFRETSRLFDRPPVLFAMFEPLIGAASIQFANGVEGRTRRNNYDKAFAHEAVARMMPTLEACVDELGDRLAKMAKKGEHIPLLRYSIGLSVKAMMRAVLEPDSSRLSDEDVGKVHRWYELIWHEMEARLNGSVTIDNSRQRTFDTAVSEMRQFIDRVVARRRKLRFKSDDEKLLIDIMLDMHSGSENADEIIRCDVITYFIGAFHTSGTLLAWTIYYLVQNPEVVQELRNELESVVGKGELNLATINQLNKMHRCIQESMRVSCLAPMSARIMDVDSDIGGYQVLANTPLLLAHSVVYNCEAAYPEPEQFSIQRNHSHFEPYGLGRRKCPGYRLANAELALWLAKLISRFDFQLADTEYRAVPQFGLVTRPSDEIWLVAKERQE